MLFENCLLLNKGTINFWIEYKGNTQLTTRYPCSAMTAKRPSWGGVAFQIDVFGGGTP
jgi:hypothetical protein